MSANYTDRLFYVVKESNTVYSLYSIQTDHLILAEVAADAISDFLFLNEPHNPALSYLERASLYNPDSVSVSNGTLSYHTTFSTYDCYDHWDAAEVSRWEGVTLNNLTVTDLDNSNPQLSFNFVGLDDSPKQLSFSFSSDLKESCDDVLDNFIINPDDLDNVAKAQVTKVAQILNGSMNNTHERYTHTGKTNGPKTQYESNSEWKNLDIDED